MVVARRVDWKIKRGMRKEALEVLKRDVIRAGPEPKGYLGVLLFEPMDDPDLGVSITLWENEESLNTSFREIVQPGMKKLEKFTAGQPKVTNYRLNMGDVKEIHL